MPEVLTAEQVLDLVSRRWPGEEARILHLLGTQAAHLRSDLASNGGSIIGVTPPAGYTESTLNDLLAEIAAAIGSPSIQWGSITGLLANQTDLSSALAGKAAAGHGHASGEISFNDTGLVSAHGTTVAQAIASLDDSTQDKLSTGIVYGGVGTVVGGVGVGSTVNVTEGRCAIIDTTVPQTPVYTPITFGPFTGVALVNTGVDYTWWYIDSAGTLSQQTTRPTPAQYRTRVYLFRTEYRGGVIVSIISIPNPIQHTAANLGDLARAIGAVFIEGCRPAPNGANLKITRNSGRLVYWGGGYATTPLDPHEIILPAQAPVSFRMIQAAGNPSALVTDLPVSLYEASGVLTPVPGAATRATIFTVMQLPSGAVLIQYDNTYYNDIPEARIALSRGTRTFTPNTTVAQADGVVSGFIIVQSGATDLSQSAQAMFVQTNKFGELGGGASAAEVARWGGIVGTLGDQADLSALIAGKQNADVQLDSLAALSYAGNAGKVVKVNPGETGFELGDAGGGWVVATAGTTLTAGGPPVMAFITTNQTFPLPVTIVAGQTFALANSKDSTAGARAILSVGVGRQVNGFVVGDNPYLNPGDAISLVARDATNFDVVGVIANG